MPGGVRERRSSRFGGSFARCFLASPLTRVRPRYFSFCSPRPPPPKKKNRHLLHRVQLCRRLRQLDELEHGRTKHGRSCRSIPEARCGICVNLVKFLIGRESGINFFFLPILKLDLAKPSLSAVIIHSTHD